MERSVHAGGSPSVLEWASPQKDESNPHVWSIILAGGDGRRLEPLIVRWLNRARPKQYCTFVGTRSMLQHTLDRADRLSSPHRQITVVQRAHLADADPQVGGKNLIAQPVNRDTGAGIFVGLIPILSQDPDATVVVFPSDHFVFPEARFIEVAAAAVEAVSRMPDRLILMGVAPDGPEREYGWVFPGPSLCRANGHDVREVTAFLEKPTASEAESALAGGALWNTFVFAAKARMLWRMGWQYFPEMMGLLMQISDALGTEREHFVVENVYRTIPHCNFSAELLTRAVDHIGIIRLDGVLWSDWGSPKRIAETLRRIGKQPAFPWECLHDATGSRTRAAGA